MEGTPAEQSDPEHMKLSVEAKVAMAVAMAFAALSLGAIAQEGSEQGTARLGQMNVQGLDSYMSAHADAGESPLLAQY
jgi:hypothetical protein